MSKKAVVTGGTKGIGKEITRQLVEKGYEVLIIGRDADSGNAVVSEIKSQFSGSEIAYLQGDLGSIRTTKDVIRGIQEHYPEFDLLINNAGVWSTKMKLNEDGLEFGFMVNHIAPLLLIHGLLPQLKAKAPARIVNVNSGLYVRGVLNLEDTPYGKDFHSLNTYANTKLWNTFASLEMAERIPVEQVSVNALHPGVIRTGLGDMRGILGALLNVAKLFWKKPEEGAQSPVWVATAPELEGVTGKYYNIKEEWAIADNAKSEEDRKAVWEKSLELAGIEWS